MAAYRGLVLAPLLLGGIWFVFGSMPQIARWCLMVFALAIAGWSILELPETPLAIASGLALVGLNATTLAKFYAGMDDDLIRLLIRAFILAAGLVKSGMAERFAVRAIDRVTSVQALFVRLTWVIMATALVVPSTSARAALPLFVTLARSIQQPKVVRALALLFPSVILLSASASLLGAGAHLVAVDFISRCSAAQENLGYLDWMLLGVPFAIASTFAAMHVILRLFVRADDRLAALQLPSVPVEPLGQQ